MDRVEKEFRAHAGVIATTAKWFAFEKVRQLKIVTTEAKGRVRTGDEPIFTKTRWYHTVRGSGWVEGAT